MPLSSTIFGGDVVVGCVCGCVWACVGVCGRVWACVGVGGCVCVCVCDKHTLCGADVARGSGRENPDSKVGAA